MVHPRPARPSSSSSSSRTAKRKRSDRASRPSARYQRVLEDDGYAEQIQQTYSPSTTTNASTRALPLEVVKQRDGDHFKVPSLASICLEVMAKNFLTHVLPSQQAYEEANGITTGSGRGKAKQQPVVRSNSTRTVKASKLIGVVTSGIGIAKKRRTSVGDEAEGQDFLPSDDSDAEAANVGIASGPSNARRNRGGGRRSPASSVRSHMSLKELTDLSRENHQLLKLLPDTNASKLLRLLKRYCPPALTRPIITSYFVNGRSQVELDASMTLLSERPDQINLIVSYIGKLSPPSPSSLPSLSSPPLTRLSLSGVPRLSPQPLCALFRRSPCLQEVILKGCVRVDTSCMQALVDGGSAESLRILNANFTDIGPKGVEVIISHARSLVTLKVANVLGLRDQIVTDMARRAVLLASEQTPPFSPLANLRSLKVRGTEMTVVGLSSLVQLCTPTLENLDIRSLDLSSEHQVHLLVSSLGYEEVNLKETRDEVPPAAGSKAPLRKLNISQDLHRTGNLIYNARQLDPLLLHLLPQIASTLETLILDGLPLRYKQLDDLAKALAAEDHSERLREASEVKLRRLSLSATGCAALCRNDLWVHNDGRGSVLSIVETLNLSQNNLSIAYLLHVLAEDALPYPEIASSERSSSPHERMWKVRHLDLTSTGIGDEELAAFASRCARLETIDLSETSVTAEGVQSLVRKCPFLVSINLTGCRGVPVRMRRNFFDFV